jgi:type IV fimbrial biogenesis protein FimT
VLSAVPKAKFRGFTLVELMMGIVVVGVVATIAVPSFRTWFLNAQVRAAAESISNGLQRARAEAVSRNANVEFILGAGTNTSWTVNYATLAGNPAPVNPPLDSRASTEGSSDVTRAVLPAGATTLTFNNFGGVVANADGSASLTQVDVNAAALDATAASRSVKQSLRIIINLGGGARMCDPSLPATNARGC